MYLKIEMVFKVVDPVEVKHNEIQEIVDAVKEKVKTLDLSSLEIVPKHCCIKFLKEI